MGAVLKREISAYFSSPIGYIFLAVFMFFSGLFTFAISLSTASANMSGVFSSMITVILFLIPILTMRLLSEERKQKTDQALLTAPVSLLGIIMGKFLAAVIIFAIGLSSIVVMALIISAFGVMDWAVLFGNVLGMLLFGAALIAVGLFISSITENQVIAAVVSFAVMLGLWMIEGIASLIPTAWIKTALTSVSITSHYSEFTMGIFNFANVIFFLSIIAVFLFLTVRVFEKRRWG